VPGDAGTVLARCVGGTAQVVSATPAQGFDVTTQQEPGEDHTSVRFSGRGGQQVEVRLSCPGGTLRSEIRHKH
jgi:hypothetical protein